MSRTRLKLEKKGGIFHLRLSAPPANPTDQLFFRDLEDLLPRLTKKEETRGLIIYGEKRHFSSGANIDDLLAGIRKNHFLQPAPTLQRAAELFDHLARLHYPTVAAIQGCCLGSGLELALTTRFRIGTKTSLFSLPETTFGLMPGCGGTLRFPRLVGQANAVRLILSGDHFGADEALRMGLISAIVDKKELISVAERLIKTVSHRP